MILLFILLQHDAAYHLRRLLNHLVPVWTTLLMPCSSCLRLSSLTPKRSKASIAGLEKTGSGIGMVPLPVEPVEVTGGPEKHVKLERSEWHLNLWTIDLRGRREAPG